MRVVKKCNFIEFEPLCHMLWPFLSNFCLFYDVHSPNMSCQVIQEANVENILFCPNSIFQNIEKNHKISSEKALYFRSYQPPPTPPPPPPPVLLGLTLSGPGFEKLAQTGGGRIPPPLLTLLPCIRTKPNLVWANTII